MSVCQTSYRSSAFRLVLVAPLLLEVRLLTALVRSLQVWILTVVIREELHWTLTPLGVEVEEGLSHTVEIVLVKPVLLISLVVPTLFEGTPS